MGLKHGEDTQDKPLNGGAPSSYARIRYTYELLTKPSSTLKLQQDVEAANDGYAVLAKASSCQQLMPVPLVQQLAKMTAQHKKDGSRGGDKEDMKAVNLQGSSTPATWLRPFILGANDGLVSVAAIMIGVGGGTDSYRHMILSGLAALVGGALSMAVGEFVSVSAQRDAEEAQITQAIQLKDCPSSDNLDKRKRKYEDIVQSYKQQGMPDNLARTVADDLRAVEQDALRAAASDAASKSGDDDDSPSDPTQAALASSFAFVAGGTCPLLGGAFVQDYTLRTVLVLVTTTLALLLFGVVGALMGNSHRVRGAVRVLVGGWIALAVTYGAGCLFASQSGA